MMDFFRVCTRESRKKGGPIEVYADYTVGRSEDLMIQGGTFYAVWDEEKGLWSRREIDVQVLMDKAIRKKSDELTAEGIENDPKYLTSFDNGRWEKFRKFLRSMPDNSHPLDTKVVFAGDTKLKKTDYASRRLPYSMAAGDTSAYDELISKLYTPEERKKFEWGIGAIIAGKAKEIQKFFVFFGGPGTGKSTVLEIISKLFGGKVKDGGYVAFFDAQGLTGNTNAFATAAFKDNPLVAIQHDGDLSRIETNARLNAITAHEEISINEKNKAQYDNRINAFLFMGTNKPVQITDAKSGLIRRLIDVNPTGETHEKERYDILIQRVNFELGVIAHHCLQVYRQAGKNAYSDYTPDSMILRTDAFANFVDENHEVFKGQDYTTLTQAWELYKLYCEEAKLRRSLTKIQFGEELKNYFETFERRGAVDGVQTRSVYKRFKSKQFRVPVEDKKSKGKTYSLVLDEEASLLDEMYAGLQAQYGNSKKAPQKYWDDAERMIEGVMRRPRPDEIANTVLGDLDTHRLHFLRVPTHHIVIDFDLKDDDGKKSLERSLEAASSWPPTYAEISQGGNGVHLHYIWDGDVDELANEYSPGIEIKVYRGYGALRRRLTKCNNVAVATINSGLPFREKKTMMPNNTLKTEQGLRKMIIRNLRKEIHSGTKPSIDFINHLLDEAYKSGMVYDVSDMKPEIIAFAAQSTNQAPTCIRCVAGMRFASELSQDEVNERFEGIVKNETRDQLVFFDCEVYPNLFVICWKYQGSDTVVRMINPSPAEVEEFVRIYKLVGYNNRSYDNHMLYGRILGMNNEQLYKLSQRIIVEKDDSAKFGKAWGLSYADVYDFASVKQTLKKWEIDLGIPHIEMDIPWDKPVPEKKIMQVVDYCCNDVRALEAVFNACAQDYVARQVLADLSGLTVNNSTRQHAIRIMFGNEREPQKQFVYTDLSEMFPDYKFDKYAKVDKSTYKDETVGEGGYVYAEPGMYENVAVLDIASMHPTSIIELNLFGPYTENFQRLVDARLALKHDDVKTFEKLMPNVPYPATVDDLEALSQALKLVINSIYGYTCAKFDNPFRDPRNIDNIVAKRGALFMVDLKKAVQEQGFTVAHIKTDSIKIPNATPDIIAFVQEFGAKYGYTFEHEATYKKMCLVNDAVLIAYVGWHAKGKPEHWKAVGKEFQHPVVFKGLFTDEPITFKDLCETKQVKKGAMYLKYDGVQKEIGEPKEAALGVDIDIESLPDSAAVDEENGDAHIGRSGLFVAINPDQDIFQGGELVCRRDDLDNKDYAVPGTKGYLWAEAEMVRALQDGAIDRMIFERIEDAVEGTGSIADVIDMRYYYGLMEDAAQSIEAFGNFEEFADRGISA
jgi:phage/plasmid-associated DNA primase